MRDGREGSNPSLSVYVVRIPNPKYQIPNIMTSLSVSALNTYTLCPRKYHYSYIERLPSPPEERTYRRSRLLSTVLADFHSKRSNDWVDLDQSLLSYWDSSLFSDASNSAFEYHAARWMLWESFGEITSGNPIRWDWSFQTDFGGGRFRGRIERIDDHEDTISITKYAIGDRADENGLRILAAIASREFRKSVREIRVLRLDQKNSLSITPGDAARIESDVARMRRAIASDSAHRPRPGAHCRYCSYSGVCEDAPRPARKNELFRVVSALEILFSASDDPRRALETAIRQVDRAARIEWFDGLELDPALLERSELSGDIEIACGRARVIDGIFTIVPISSTAAAVFPEGVSRAAAEICGRSFRAALAQAETHRAATRDGLTGLFRREVSEHDLTVRRQPYILLLLDIDRFKSINDTHGHAAGDEALRVVAGALRSRADGVAYRMGGEEFLLAVPNASIEHGLAIAESVRAQIEAADFQWSGQRVSLTASFGVAPLAGGELGAALECADRALYRSKEEGRNRVTAA